MGKQVHFNTECGKKYWLYRKILQTKVIHNLISPKKLSERIFLFTLEVELEGSKDLPFLKYYNAQEWESAFTLWNTAKDIDYIEK